MNVDKKRKLNRALIMIPALLCFFAIPLFRSDYLTYMGMRIIILALFALSFNLLLGYAGLLSFGHAAFYAVGGYTTALVLIHGTSELVFGIICGGVMGGLFAFVVGYFCVKRTRIYFSMLTLAFGMLIYFKLASTMKIGEQSIEGVRKSVRRLDLVYLLIVIASGVGVIGSIAYYNAGNYASAVLVTIILLGASVLLYGLWLYRDAVSAVMIKGTLSRKRIVAGLWHLVFVPGIIVMILVYGSGIDWFKAYISVLDDQARSIH